MAKNGINVNAYIVRVYRTYKEQAEDFVESISDSAIIYVDRGLLYYEIFVIAQSDVLNITELSNKAYKFFGEDYYIGKLGMLGPFKKLN